MEFATTVLTSIAGLAVLYWLLKYYKAAGKLGAGFGKSTGDLVNTFTA